MMSSSSGSEDAEFRLHSPLRILKEFTLKFLIIGDYGVGKTAIVRRYAEGKQTELISCPHCFVYRQYPLLCFDVKKQDELGRKIIKEARFYSDYPDHDIFSHGITSYKVTIGADFSIKSIIWDNTTQINIQLWDIAGNEQFGSMTRIYYKYAAAAVIVFDVSRIATFQSIQKWLTDIREKVVLSDGSDIPVIIMANKSDIAGSSVPTDALDKLCKESDISGWYKTSAKDNHNIEEAMGFLISCAMKNKMKEAAQNHDSITLKKEPAVAERERSCC